MAMVIVLDPWCRVWIIWRTLEAGSSSVVQESVVNARGWQEYQKILVIHCIIDLVSTLVECSTASGCKMSVGPTQTMEQEHVMNQFCLVVLQWRSMKEILMRKYDTTYGLLPDSTTLYFFLTTTTISTFGVDPLTNGPCDGGHP